MTKKWFHRLAEVPGIGYRGRTDINRRQLPGHNSVPEVNRYTFDRRSEESLSWPILDGSTSASPAQRWETKPRKGETPSQTMLRQLWEALELPGTISDYQLAIQKCYNALWDARREEPGVLIEVEALCWLSIRLIEAYPTAFLYQAGDGEERFMGHGAYMTLVQLYEREGFLHEALEVAERLTLFDSNFGLEELQTRLDMLQAEANE